MWMVLYIIQFICLHDHHSLCVLVCSLERIWLTCDSIMRAYTSLCSALQNIHTIHSVSTHYDVCIDIILSILATNLETNWHFLKLLNIKSFVRGREHSFHIYWLLGPSLFSLCLLCIGNTMAYLLNRPPFHCVIIGIHYISFWYLCGIQNLLATG